MQSPLIQALTAVIVLLVAEKCGAQPDHVARSDSALTQHFKSLNPQAQQTYLRWWLVDRFDKAAQLALPAAERKKRSLRYAEILDRVAKGSSLSSEGLQKLVDEVATVEKLAIEQLSLRFRVQVYSRFRTDRTEYDRRMATWRKTITEWQAAETRKSDGVGVLAWLSTVLDRMRYDDAGSQIVTKSPIVTDSSLPTLGPTMLAVPHRTLPPSIEMPTVAAKPLAGRELSTERQVNDPTPRLANRVERPQVPQVSRPQRGVVRDVFPDIPIPDPPHSGPVAMSRVLVDLSELAVRIRAYNLAIKELNSDLQDEQVWTAEHLGDALETLSDLTERRKQLLPYRDLISRDEQLQVGAIASLDAPVALLGTKIFASREQLSATEDDQSSAVAALNELSRKLALLAARRAK